MKINVPICLSPESVEIVVYSKREARSKICASFGPGMHVTDEKCGGVKIGQPCDQEFRDACTPDKQIR